MMTPELWQRLKSWANLEPSEFVDRQFFLSLDEIRQIVMSLVMLDSITMIHVPMEEHDPGRNPESHSGDL